MDTFALEYKIFCRGGVVLLTAMRDVERGYTLCLPTQTLNRDI